MATKAKESTVVGKEKKAPSSNSHITTTKRSTSKPSQTTKATTSNTPSDKNIPNYLKPTISSRLESPSTFKQPKSDAIAPNKPNLNRRRSFDKPISSSSNLAKHKQPSPSRLHKALVSPGPRERIVVSHRSSTVPNKSTKPSKPISDKTSKNPKEGKTKLLYVKKSTPSHSSSTSTNKVANDHAKNTAGTAKGTKVEAEEVKEVTNQEVEVIKTEYEENHVEHVSEISQHVDSEHDEQHVLEHDLEGSDQPHHNQANEHEKVISIVSEEELKNEPQEEKTEDEEHEEEENTNHDNSNNNGSHPEEQSKAEEEQEQEQEVMVNEKEDEGGVVIEDHTSENNNEELEAVVEEIEVVEGGTSTEEVEEAKVEATPPKQQGKKESQVSNDVIEETASKLLEERKNKVRALAGAFQTVIDYQTTSK